jgi:hypothetical protein
MKTILVTLLLLAGVSAVGAQSFSQFDFEQNFNRLMRQNSFLKTAEAEQPTKISAALPALGNDMHAYSSPILSDDPFNDMFTMPNGYQPGQMMSTVNTGFSLGKVNVSNKYYFDGDGALIDCETWFDFRKHK